MTVEVLCREEPDRDFDRERRGAQDEELCAQLELAERQRATGATDTASSDERCRKEQRTDRQQETRQRVVLVPPRLREEGRERERESCNTGGGRVRPRRACNAASPALLLARAPAVASSPSLTYYAPSK